MLQFDDPRFMELCRIVHERNELCRRRNSVRNKLYRLKRTWQNKAHNSRVDRLTREMTTSIENKKKKITEASTDLINCMDNVELIGYSRQVRDTTERAIGSLQNHADRLSHQLSEMPEKQPVSKRYQNMKQSDLKLKVLEFEHERAGINLDIARFTKRTHMRLVRLLKELKVELIRAAYYNRIDGIRLPNGDIMWRNQLEDLGVTSIMEQEMFRDE